MAKKKFPPTEHAKSLHSLFCKKKYQTTLPTCYVYQANCQFISIPIVNHGNYEQHYLGTWILIYMNNMYIYKSALYFYVDPTNWNYATIYYKSLREFSECTYFVQIPTQQYNGWSSLYFMYTYTKVVSAYHSHFYFKTTSRKTGFQASLIKRRWKEFEIVWFWSGYFEKQGR